MIICDNVIIQYCHMNKRFYFPKVVVYRYTGRRL